MIDLDTRTCLRCGFTLPLGDFPQAGNPDFPGGGHRQTCGECSPNEPLYRRVVLLAVEMKLAVIAAAALLRLGLYDAALRVLDGHPCWPSLRVARYHAAPARAVNGR